MSVEPLNDRLIVQTFMKELCKRDSQNSRSITTELSQSSIVYSIEEIRQAVLSEYSIVVVRRALRGYMLENIGNDPLELLDGDANVRLAESGRARCHEYGS